RLLGVILLVFLLTRIDVIALVDTLKSADPLPVLVSVILVVLLISIKTVRWQGILRAQAIALPLTEALIAYFASLFIGFLTPGRLGEFSRALYISEERNTRPGVAFSSVLADRLFDLYALLLVGCAALYSLGTDRLQAYLLILFFIALTAPFALFLYDRFFLWLRQLGQRIGIVGRNLFAEDGWLVGMRDGLMRMSVSWLLVSMVLTVLSYGVFFGQCYLLSRAVGIRLGFMPITYAVALGSLVTLLPFSISGLGTREATITAYLALSGVRPEVALSFSLLVFATFYIAGGLMGAVAWWIKPVPFSALRRVRE
ncbi:MAG: flippase-like domain-containing protein, partial [Anaerolineales bacterium]|nr:flippase-like domain-containing protein [Anaerolineales bacterium]